MCWKRRSLQIELIAIVAVLLGLFGALSIKFTVSRLRAQSDESLRGRLVAVGGVQSAPGFSDPGTANDDPYASLERSVALQIAGLTILTAGVLILFMTRRFVRPLRDLADAMRVMAAGDLSRDIRIESGDELGALASAANRMRVEVARLLREKEEQRRFQDELMARVSHDMLAPLAAMIGFATLSGDERLDGQPERRRHYAEAVARSGRVLQVQARGLLDNARLEGGIQPPVRHPFCLYELIEEVLYLLEPLLRNGDLGVSNLVASTVIVHADREQIRSVLTNLVSNAIRHTQSGGAIVLEADVEIGRATIGVLDTGRGISRDNMSRLFQKFAPLEGNSRGTGLGLYIVRSILEAHGQRVWLDSEPGKGTRACFTLDLAGPVQAHGRDRT